MGNLLDNAMHWTPAGGTVRLEGTPARRRRVLGGRAPTPARASRRPSGSAIFEPFQSQETPDGRRGSGLGLAISRQLARALGDVAVESREGAGSRFRLELPAGRRSRGRRSRR